MTTDLDIYNPTKVRGIVESLEHDLSALRKENEALRAMLEEVSEMLDDYVDVVDGSYGEPRPNKAMSMKSEIDALLAKEGEERHE